MIFVQKRFLNIISMKLEIHQSVASKQNDGSELKELGLISNDAQVSRKRGHVCNKIFAA